MSKPTGIEAAVKELIDTTKICYSPEEWSQDEAIRGFTAIIARHCVDDYLFQTAQAASIKYAGEVRALTEERTQLLAACKEYRKKLDKSESYIAELEKQLHRLA